MKFDEIKKLPHRSVVTMVEGRIKNIYTKTPSANQAKYNLHPQEIILLDDNGSDMTVVIMKKDMHLPAGCQGRVARFEAGENDKGMPDGLFIDIYNNNPAKVNCGGYGSVRLLEGEPQKLPDAKPSSGSIRLVNIKDHEQTIVNLFNSIVSKLDPESMTGELAAKLATTVYIECSKNGLIQPTVEGNPVPEEIQKMAESKTPEAEAPEETNKPSLGELVAKKLAKEPVDIEKMEKLLKKIGKNWQQVYDEMAHQISRTYPSKYVDQVYDEFNGMRLAHGSKETEEEFHKKLFSDSETFTDTVKDVYTAENSKQQAVEDDDIPF